MSAWLDFGLSAGMDLLKAGMGYMQAKQQADSDKAWARYHNALIRLQTSENLNNISEQREMNREASLKQGMQIKQAQYTTEASATVAAAAAGVQGRSVDQTMNQIDTNAAEAESNRLRQLQWQNNAFESQRRATVLQAQASMETPKSDPSPWQYVGNALVDIGKLWKDDSKALRL